jgi:hypothetical protein
MRFVGLKKVSARICQGLFSKLPKRNILRAPGLPRKRKKEVKKANKEKKSK